MLDEVGGGFHHASRATAWTEAPAFATELLRALITGPPALNRHALSKEFCRRIGWFKPNGGLKDMMARVTMLALHNDGLITLPPPKGRQNRPGPIAFGPHTEPPLFPAPTTLEEVRPLDLRPVVRATREGKLWNEFIARSLPSVWQKTPTPARNLRRTGTLSARSGPRNPPHRHH